MSITKHRKPEFRIYKPNKNNNGAASSFQVRIDVDEETGRRKCYLFLVSTPQTGKDEQGNSAFAWKDKDKSITMKLGLADIGEILAVLNGRKPIAGGDKGFFHRNSNGSTTLTFSFKDTYYGLKVTKQVGQAAATQLLHTLTMGEGEVLKVLLEDFVRLTHNWVVL